MRPVAQIWFPEGYTERVTAFLVADNNEALVRSLEGLQAQTSTRRPIENRWEILKNESLPLDGEVLVLFCGASEGTTPAIHGLRKEAHISGNNPIHNHSVRKTNAVSPWKYEYEYSHATNNL